MQEWEKKEERSREQKNPNVIWRETAVKKKSSKNETKSDSASVSDNSATGR